MNEGLRDTKIGLQRCEQCTYFTPIRQPACANCGWRRAGDTPDLRPDEAPPVVTPDLRVTPPRSPATPTGRSRTRMTAVILGLSVAVAGAWVLAWNTNIGAAPASGAVAVTSAPAPVTAADDDSDACARWHALRP